MSATEAVADDSQNVECLIHVRFNPDGTVADIGERPEDATATAWFKYVSRNTRDRYQALAGGRGMFRVPRPEVDTLKASWIAEQR
jgi:hypothetical protein